MNLEEYRNEIDWLIINGLDENISNGSVEHAAVIIERMFKHARHSIKILTRTFDPQIFGQPDVIQYAETFLADTKNRSVEILVEEYNQAYNNSHPFVTRFGHMPNVAISELPKGLGAKIDTNFAVMDSQGVRMETERGSPKAFANFGDSAFAMKLNAFFNAISSIGNSINGINKALVDGIGQAAVAGPISFTTKDAPER